MKRKKNSFRKKERIVWFIFGSFVFAGLLVFGGLYYISMRFASDTTSLILDIKEEFRKNEIIDTFKIERIHDKK